MPSQRNKRRHEMKVQRVACWLARWGVADGPTLVQLSYAQNKAWPKRLVEIGMAQPVDVAKMGVLKLRTVYVATPACRAIARAAGHNLVAPYTMGSDLTHRILTERACAHLIKLGFDLGLDFGEYVTDPEMRRHGTIVPGDELDRLPDAKLKFHSIFRKNPGENDGGVIYIEIERHIRSTARLGVMCTGITKILSEKTSVHASDSILIVCESQRVANSYSKAMAPGTVFDEYKRRGKKYVSTGRKLKMPPGVHVVVVNSDGYPEIDAKFLATLIHINDLENAFSRGRQLEEIRNQAFPKPPGRQRSVTTEEQPAPAP